MTAFEDAFRGLLEPVVTELRQVREELRQVREALPPQMVSPAEAGRRLGLSEPTVRRRIKDRTIPATKVGRRLLIDLSKLRPVDDQEIARLATEARRGGRS